MNFDHDANLALAQAAEQRAQVIQPLHPYDVERELSPWFPWLCVAVAFAFAFGPIVYDWLKALL